MAQKVQEGLGSRRAALGLVYATVMHDASAVLKAVREVLGNDVPIFGCSVQGVMARGTTIEDGYLVGLLALGGDAVQASIAQEEGIQIDTEAKARSLGRALRAGLAVPPKAVLLHHDPLVGTDMGIFLGALEEEVGCPVVGGGAGQPFGRNARTFQYFMDRSLSGGAVAAAVGGDLTVVSDFCHGTIPVGIEMSVTKTDGNWLLELDGRPALDVWIDILGKWTNTIDHNYTAALALGFPYTNDEGQKRYLVRGAFGMDEARRSLLLPAALPLGTRVMLQHRSIEGVLEGTNEMAQRLRRRIAPPRVRAAIGFECAARTEPFLGRARTLKENLDLQNAVAPDAAWLGSCAWGEVHPVAGHATFHNYTFPVILFADVS
ncbi:MAG: FIST signal transduction protein [Myxococcales bacterium]